MKKKVHKLVFKPEYEFVVIGISSHENDYRLSWAINNFLKLNLTRSEHLVIKSNDNNTLQEFPVFLFNDDDNYLTYSLISNKCETGFLLNEYKNIDFIMKITGEVSIQFISNLVKEIKKINIVNTSFQIDLSSLKSKKKLIF